jgi:UDP:flavonoid glycosyltransferase YjiC (YdhE family)
MQLTIVALGSFGDVLPFVALGKGLLNAGYGVRIATFQTFADLIAKQGLQFAPVDGDPRQVLQSQTGQIWLESGKNPVKFITMLRKLYSPESLQRALKDTLAACRGSDAVLYTPLGAAGYHVAEKMGIPRIYLILQPVSRTREYPSIFMPQWKIGAGYNWISYLITEQLMWQTLRVQANRWRVEILDLKPMPYLGPFNILYRDKAPMIFGYSQHVVPRPADIPDWHHITGYWFLESEDDWSPPAGLEGFLAKKPKPIYIGFGSMSGGVARDLVRMTIEALERSKQRAVVVGGWAEAHQDEFPETVYACDYAPHEWLFPQMAAVVHHGGAGTTAAGIRAGIPSIIIPFMGDQPFWGRRVYELGVGPEPVSRRGLTAELLGNRITQAVSDPTLTEKASVLREKIRAEDGVSEAVQLITRYIVTK